jgi:queuine tRNA-ribosyltransferase
LHSRAYLRHLFMVSEPSGARLLSWHNLAWQLRLMSDIRQAIVAGRLGELRRGIAAAWD